jgi:hypothetical protein
MIRKYDNQEDLYHVTCADWESVISAKDENEAAALSVEGAHEEYGRMLCLAPSMVVMNLTTITKSLDAVESTHIIYTPTVLANAGMHSLAKKYAKVIKLIKDDPDASRNLQ